ncbi:MAG TPA: sigma-70 family RNA polymerase sigma factor [Opitutaceae bacterium]|nr:sigma-70 family RNA polymerase sigma factor [Opitutaceae bacterium]
MPSVPERSSPSTAAPVVAFTEIGDLAAIDDVVRGNREMFEVIVRRYNPQLFRIGMAYLRDHAQAEDAMQNAYVKAFLHLARFQRGAAFSTWLTRIMINECLMLLRRRRRHADETSLDAAPPDLAPADPSATPPADHIHRKEMSALLEQAVQALPRNHRAVYLLREVQQLSTAETAACLGMSVASVKVTLHRARERLKAELLKSAAGAELFPYPAFFCDRMTARVLGIVLAAS